MFESVSVAANRAWSTLLLIPHFNHLNNKFDELNYKMEAVYEKCVHLFDFKFW